MTDTFSIQAKDGFELRPRVDIKVEKVSASAVMPSYATDGSGAFDLTACGTPQILSSNDSTMVFNTGLKFEIPEDHVMLIFSRSGHGFNKNIRLANCVGVIDSDYRGEVKVKLKKDSGDYQFSDPNIGERIAQAIVLEIPRCKFIEVESLSETDRGTGGFGSTGA